MSEKVLDTDWMKALLADEEIGHLGLADGVVPYVVPINYAYLEGKIVMHCAMQGRKLEIIRKNSQCCLAVSRHPDKVKFHLEKKCHYRYHSVIIQGRARFVESAEERLNWIHKFRDHFNNRLAWTIQPNQDIKTAERCGIIVIEIDSLTGRKEEGPDPNANEAIDK